MHSDSCLELLAQLTYAKQYLIDTDFKMTADYNKDVTEIKAKRAEARAFLKEQGL